MVQISIEAILLIIFISIYVLSHFNINIGINNRNQINVENFSTIYLDPNIKKNKLLSMLYIFHRLCEEKQIYYIIGFGSLLGAVRHWGIIPWDDDVDVIVRAIDRPKIYKLLNEIRDVYGIKIENTEKLSRIILTEGDPAYCIDLFFADNINGKVVRTYTNDYDKIQDTYKEYYLENNKDNEWWWNGFNFNIGLIEERKKFLLDDLSVWGPVKPDELLKFWYGDNYLTTCKTHYLKNHIEYVEQKDIQCGVLPSAQL